jgi:hypothetical protein
MKKTSKICAGFVPLLAFLLLLPLLGRSQGYIDFSTYLGGTGKTDDVRVLNVENGYTYVSGYTDASNFPVTDGSTGRIYVAKLDGLGNVVWATRFGGAESLLGTLEVVNGETYVMGRSNKNSLSVTNDLSTDSGAYADLFFLKLDANGAISFCTVFGGDNVDVDFTIAQCRIIDGTAYLVGDTYSHDLPVTDGSTAANVYTNPYAVKLSPNGNLVYAKYLNCNGDCEVSFEEGTWANFNVENGQIVTVVGGYSQARAIKLDASGNYVFNNQLNGYYYGVDVRGVLDNGNYYTVVTDGDGYLKFIKVDAAGNVSETLLQSTLSNLIYEQYQIIDGVLYSVKKVDNNSVPSTDGSVFSGPSDVLFLKVDINSGNILTASYIGGSGSEYSPIMYLDGSDVHILSNTYSSDYPVTNGSMFMGGSEVAYTKIDANGNILFSTLLGGTNKEFALNDANIYDFSFFASGNDVYIGGLTVSNNFPVTNTVLMGASSEGFVTKLSLCPTIAPSGDNSLSPATQTTCSFGLTQQITASEIELAGSNLPTIYRNGTPEDQQSVTADYQWQKSDSPTGPWTNIPEGILQNYLPSSSGTTVYYRRLAQYCGQTVATSEVAAVAISSDAAPIVDAGSNIITCPGTPVSLGGTPTATGGSGSYTYLWDNGAGTDANPSVTLAVTTVYTVTVSDDAGCQQIAQVVANVVSANAGTDMSACAGTPVRIGGAPVAGLSGVVYAWSPSDGLSCTNCAQPYANPASTTTYSLEMTIPVTGGGTCMTSDQVTVNVVSAPSTANFAGPDRVICLGSTTTLGTPLVDYFEVPLVAVSQSSTNGSYAGSLTNLTDGDYATGARTNSQSQAWVMVDLGAIVDNVNRVQVAAIDAAYLNGRNVQYSTNGTSWTTAGSAISGATNSSLKTHDFTAVSARYIRVYYSATGIVDLSEIKVFNTYKYTWAPGNYLASNTTATTTFQTGNIVMPNPNPITYYLTAEKDGCTFVDAVQVAVIEARAGLDGCGPRTIGEPDRTPNINETYSWVKISGPGEFTGPTNTVQTTVSSSGASATTYELTTTYTFNGVTGTCTDEVVVPSCGGGCNIQVVSENGCAIGNVTLVAQAGTSGISNPSDFVYTWSPADGLSSTSGQSVQVLDNVNRTYTVTITSPLDPNFNTSCSQEVNNPAWSLPVFEAQDALVCPNISVNIGAAPVAGYSYVWSNGDLISNPSVSPTETTVYTVIVTDDLSGCAIKDTATVTVSEVIADAGDDWTTCNNVIVQLGTPAQANHTYAWSPVSADWQNSTNSTSAQPEVLIATDITFFLTVTNELTGCTKMDTVEVIVDSNPPTIPDAQNVSKCAGSAGVLIGSPAIEGLIYTWTPSTGLSCTDCAQPTANPTGTITYTLHAVYAGGCTNEATDQVTVTVNPLPTFTLNDITYCPSAGPVELGADAPSGMSAYLWSPANKVTKPTAQNPSTLTPAPSSATTYSLTVTDANGCQASDNITITPNVATPIAGNSKSICLGSSTNLGSASNPTGAGISYSWSPTTGLSNPASPNPTFTPTANGTYTFTVTKDENGCVSNASVTITVNSFSLPAMASPTVCQNASIQIGTTPVSGVTYIWSPSTGLSNPNIANPYVTMGTSGQTYTLTAIGLNGCPDTKSLTVNVASTPAPTVELENLNTCLGMGSVQLDASVSPSGGDYSYQWSPNDGSLSSIYVEDPTASLFGSGSKTYTLTVTDNATGCSSIKAMVLNIAATCPELPVEWAYFEGKAQGCANLLTWGTASERGSSHFVVLKSRDGKRFEEIGGRTAAGNSTAAQDYGFTDAEGGDAYYRILQVDSDKQQMFSRTLFVKGDCNTRSSITVYPNPASDVLNVSYETSHKGSVHLLVMDISGKVVFEMPLHVEKGINQARVPVAQLPNGYYVISARGEDAPVARKFVKAGQ